jgi:hypothetical protein
MTNGRPPAINSSTALGGRLPTSLRILLSHQDNDSRRNHERLTKVIVLIGLALFLASASFAQQVKTDYDRRKFQSVQNL